ncbi:hypothetical protein AVEN_130413-1 [Araneus ventricosus]|uniref:Uncharacterized protein n=1 Tax=Araneus ventricosus TaxID=182803 RepID=A0A4Y2BGQ6_ARAVE|nr:hypothetical protein AVEN_130413-1 [Araneus ventricosus]
MKKSAEPETSRRATVTFSIQKAIAIEKGNSPSQGHRKMRMEFEGIGSFSFHPGRGRKCVSAWLAEDVAVQVEEERASNIQDSTIIHNKYSANV